MRTSVSAGKKHDCMSVALSVRIARSRRSCPNTAGGSSRFATLPAVEPAPVPVAITFPMLLGNLPSEVNAEAVADLFDGLKPKNPPWPHRVVKAAILIPLCAIPAPRPRRFPPCADTSAPTRPCVCPPLLRAYPQIQDIKPHQPGPTTTTWQIVLASELDMQSAIRTTDGVSEMAARVSEVRVQGGRNGDWKSRCQV
eukprot:9841-Chlamydomonas_euryale.AAC.2